MSIEKHSKVFVPVSVDTRLPKQMFNTVNSGDSWKVAYFHKDAKVSEQWTDDLYGKHLTFPTHFLEEKNNCYVLSEQELKEFAWAAAKYYKEHGFMDFTDNFFTYSQIKNESIKQKTNE